MISVVIRTKNEEQWIGRCLAGVKAQSVRDVEIIVVDNQSTDSTLGIAEWHGCKIINIGDDKFTFGRALNWGIDAAAGEYIAIISGHCVPTDDRWLSAFHSCFEDRSIAGAYGRQEPLPDTSPNDKRDLWTTFGIEPKIQKVDYFFHNANSMIVKDIWEKLPFDEEIQGVEDRDWAKKVLGLGYKIAYQPLANVYHFHGIHHDGNPERSQRVARVIESIGMRGA